MAGAQITLDSAQVLAIASSIEGDNNKLHELLEQSNQTIAGTTNIWTGKAADATRSAYKTHADKFFQTYFEVLEQYVKFLRTNVSAQYEETENANANLSEMFL